VRKNAATWTFIGKTPKRSSTACRKPALSGACMYFAGGHASDQDGARQ
jgi:hypothetical protein